MQNFPKVGINTNKIAKQESVPNVTENHFKHIKYCHNQLCCFNIVKTYCSIIVNTGLLKNLLRDDVVIHIVIAPLLREIS